MVPVCTVHTFRAVHTVSAGSGSHGSCSHAVRVPVVNVYGFGSHSSVQYGSVRAVSFPYRFRFVFGSGRFRFRSIPVPVGSQNWTTSGSQNLSKLVIF